MNNEKQTRLSRLISKLPSEADAILVTNQKNRRYLTNFNSSAGYVLVTRKKSYFITDSRYFEAAKMQSNKEFEVLLQAGKLSDLFKNLLSENDVKTMLFEDAWVTCQTFESYKKLFEGINLLPAGNLIESMREFKDEDEIENIIKAQRIAEMAFEHILGFITPDKTEVDIALELEFFMRSHGATSTSFDTIAVSGTASSQPHGVPRYQKLEKGFLTMDFGALYNGYCSDMTRTVCIGKADDEMKKIYNTVLEAQLAAIAAVKEGVTGAELDKVARDIIYGAGYEGKFGHGLGHGVGMYIHEAPSVSAAGTTPLTKGHVITIEPGIYIEGKCGVRIEDMVAFRENGPELLTKARKDLIELCV